MDTVLIIVLVILLLGGGGGYYGYNRYGGAGLGGALGTVLIILRFGSWGFSAARELVDCQTRAPLGPARQAGIRRGVRRPASQESRTHERYATLA
jgi:hypothetical protein